MDYRQALCLISRTSLSISLSARSIGLTTRGFSKACRLSLTAAGSGDALKVRLPYSEELISRIILEVLALGRILVVGETHTAIMELSNTASSGGCHFGGKDFIH